jgi:hypothetical protein
MSKTSKVFLTLVLLAGFGAALFFALRGQKVAVAELAIASAPELTGVVSLDVEPFFKDERVRKILADNRLPVSVTRLGSREMAAKVVPGQMPDFLFPSGVVAGNQISDAARKAGIFCGAVSWGYASVDALRAHQPDHLFMGVDEIPDILGRS